MLKLMLWEKKILKENSLHFSDILFLFAFQIDIYLQVNLNFMWWELLSDI